MKHLMLFENFTTSIDVKKVVNSYLESALWTEEERLEQDENDDIESIYGEDDDEDSINRMIDRVDCNIENIAIDSKIQAYNDIKKFIDIVGIDIIVDNDIDEEMLGHDIWLSRNGHGAGFFDRGYDQEVEDVLMDASRKLGYVDLYLGDDKFYHFSNE